jgi:hypothetical protein
MTVVTVQGRCEGSALEKYKNAYCKPNQEHVRGVQRAGRKDVACGFENDEGENVKRRLVAE